MCQLYAEDPILPSKSVDYLLSFYFIITNTKYKMIRYKICIINFLLLMCTNIIFNDFSFLTNQFYEDLIENLIPVS